MVVFHVLTYVLFNIGMFPWMMIGASLIFITAEEWQNFLSKFGFEINRNTSEESTFYTPKIVIPLLFIYVLFQFTFPLRSLFLSDNVLWTENGLRFSWHVMVMDGQ